MFDRLAAGRTKVLWIKPVGTRLEVTGRRLDGPAPPLEVTLPEGYPGDFQASGLVFPTGGCWEVEARVAGAGPAGTLRVVVPVRSAAGDDGCAPPAVRVLVDRYLEAYNRGDAAALAAVLAPEHRDFEYFDPVAGGAVHARGPADRAAWEAHLAARFALGERLTLEGVHHYDGYADVALSRAWGPAPQAPLSASAKLVCADGRLVRAVLSPGVPGGR